MLTAMLKSKNILDDAAEAAVTIIRAQGAASGAQLNQWQSLPQKTCQ